MMNVYGWAAIVIFALLGISSAWCWTDIIRTQKYTTALWQYTAENWEYAGRMNRAALSITCGVDDDDVTWYRSKPPRPVRPAEPAPTWPLRIRIGQS